MYTIGRYFTMTGAAPEGAKIANAPDDFATLADELRASTLAGKTEKPTTAATNVLPFKAPDWAINGRPAAAFAHLPIETFGIDLKRNIEEIRAAVMAIPSSAIATEPEWMKPARALAHHAAVFPDQAEELWEILDAVSRHAPGYNREDNRQRFQRYISEALNHQNPITIATAFHLARQHGWEGWAPSIMPPAPSSAWSSADLKVSFANIPHRRWLYGTYLIAGELTVLAAPGGAGKTALANGMAVELAIGRELLGENVWKGSDQTVLYLNGEDSTTEIGRRLWAFCRQHGLAEQDLARLHVAGADDPRVQSLSLLCANEKSTVVDQAGFAALEAALEAVRPDLLVLDPLVVFCGGGNMNDNAVMALVVRKLKALAVKYDCAVLIVHHTARAGCSVMRQVKPKQSAEPRQLLTSRAAP